MCGVIVSIDLEWTVGVGGVVGEPAGRHSTDALLEWLCAESELM